MVPGGGFTSEFFEIGKMRPSGEKVVDKTHDKIGCGDASVAFLDSAALQSFENAELVGDVGDKFETGKRGDFVL